MATTSNPPSITVKSAEQIKADFLNTIKNGLINIGYPNPNVTPNSYWDLIGAGFAQEAAIIGHNVQITSDQLLPYTATGTFLDNWLSFFGLTRRPATSSTGAVIATASGSSFVPAGTQLQINGLRYQVLYGGVYGNNSQIVVQSVDTGSQTIQDAGTTLQWVGTPTYFQSTAVVATNYPISGGQDAEDDATARARLSSFLSTPPGAANPSQLTEWSQESDPSVQSGVSYQAARGPATVDVTVFTYATSASQLRNVNVTTLANKISPFILGNLPLGMDGYVSNVINYPIDVSIKLSLPAPPNSNIGGPGGGFIDAAPLGVTSSKPAVRVVDGYAISGNTAGVPQNSATSFWIDAPVALLANTVYNISYLSPVTLTLTSAQTASTFTNYTNYASLASHTTLYYITVNTPFYNNSGTNLSIQPGDWIFPTAFNTQTYVNTFLTYMFGLGPGERTSNAGLLPRALRQPLDSVAFPYKINTRLIKPIIESGNEVLDGIIWYRGIYNNGSFVPVPNGEAVTDSTTFQDYGAITTNSDPAYAVYAPPTAYLYNGTSKGGTPIFVVNNFGIYSM